MKNWVDSSEKLRAILSQKKIALPFFHAVLGSGFSGALEELKLDWELVGQISFEEIGLPRTSVVGHSSSIQFFKKSEEIVSLQLGRLHGYEGFTAKNSVQPVMAFRLAGVQSFLLTNAAGGINPSYNAGDAMIIRDHVNMTSLSPLIGPNPERAPGDFIGPRFPDMSGTYDKELNSNLKSALNLAGVPVQEGVYLGLLGPCFETPSEVQLFSRWGMDAVGMSTVWETIALKHSGAKLGGVSLISNKASGLSDQKLDHETIIHEMKLAASKILSGIFQFFNSVI